MFSASAFTCIITMVFNFTIVFIISVFMFKPFFANMTVNLIKIWFVLLVCLWYPFLFFNVSYLQCVLPYGFAKLFMQFSPLYTSCFFSMSFVYIMLIFYVIKCPYRRHWMPTGNMFTYFCCYWFFRIIFRSFYFFNQRLKICINNRWCLIRLLVLIPISQCLWKAL